MNKRFNTAFSSTDGVRNLSIENSYVLSNRRHEIKELIAQLSVNCPAFKTRVFGAMQRLPLDGWAPGGREKSAPETEP